MLFKVLLIYFVFINVTAIIITIADKLKAIYNKWRISEKALIVVSALGGSIAMLITMLLIRHKTKKPLFMIGVPLIIVLQTVVVVCVMVSI
ncbi:MAG: DUF1294 domain-containing protein [Ruminococcaceae bacterium]|nr:DUF1294 domain-containing protein [Oscillospiraceae bacterium]